MDIGTKSSTEKRVAPWAFQPGQSGNPGGKAKINPDVKLMLKEGINKAIWLLLDTLENPDAPLRLRVDCANSILDRGLGKPTQAIAIDSEREFQVVFNIPRPPAPGLPPGLPPGVPGPGESAEVIDI
jgi:hypothetical protein